MTPSDRLKLLMGRGYFPRELPPVFTTEIFSNHAEEIIADWRTNNIFKEKIVKYNKNSSPKITLSSSYKYDLKGSDPEIISKPKRGFERRNIHITHPVAQSLLAKEIAYNWRKIQRLLAGSVYSIDKIALGSDNERGVNDINFKAHAAKKNFIQATADWLVQTDITRFYPSIYTHSIPWAAYGKSKVKSDIKLFAGSLADRLDILVRSCNRDQTVGIPIGPETSRIIAEILSSRIDQDLVGKIPLLSSTRANRLQDDWYVGAKDLGESERILSTLTHVYRDYGLEINGSKTSIDRALQIQENAWRSELSSFLSHRPGKLSGARLREFFDLSLRLQAQHLNEPVVNYAMSVVEREDYLSEDVEPLETFLLKAAHVSPLSLDKICRILVNVAASHRNVSLSRFRNRFTELAEKNLENGNTYEAIWLIYSIRGIKQNLDSTIIPEIAREHGGSTLPLLLLDMKSKGLVRRRLPSEHWENLITEERVERDWIWLLAYEGTRKGWLADSKGVLSKRFLKPMHDRNVTFYDESRNISRSKTALRNRFRKARADANVVASLIMQLRGFDWFFDY